MHGPLKDDRHIYTVSELNSETRNVLENSIGSVWVDAEVSGMARPASGHWYFTLKDDRSQIRCACFRNANRSLGFIPQDGQQLLVRGKISIYEARGDYQLIVEHMEPAGEGELRRAYEALRRKLEEQGLFDPEHKREIPWLPDRIGVITSPSGAAVHDILNIHARRFPGIEIIIYPASVQGKDAATQIIRMIETAVRRRECSVLILARGGGSLEDLWSFNDERLAHAIYQCPIPVVCGVGHETDFTIADFVADLRAPTPSAAIELVTPDREELLANLQYLLGGLREQAARTQRNLTQQLDWQERRLMQLHPEKQITRWRERASIASTRLVHGLMGRIKQNIAVHSQLHRRLQVRSPMPDIAANHRLLADKSTRMVTATRQQMNNITGNLQQLAHRLDVASPLATLSRGYSITTQADDDKVVTVAARLKPADRIRTRLKSGQVVSTVESVHEEDS